MKSYPFNQFRYGLVTKLPIQSIPDGAASDSLNWLTLNGKLELIRGYAILGTEQSGTGRVSGVRVGKKASGLEVPFASYAHKVRYFDSTLSTPDWVEISTDILPTGASGEDMTFDIFESRAGKQMWLNSPNTGPIKILTANPGTYVNMYDSSKNYRAWLKIFDNQAYNWCIDNTDKTVVRLSFIETRGLADYSANASEVFAAGDGATKTFSRYLNFKTKATGTITSSGVNVSDGDTVTVGSTTYRFKNTMGLAFDVQIGVDAATSLANLKKAVNLTGIFGTNYFAGTTVNATVEGTTLSTTVLTLLAKTPGTGGNSIVLTKSAATLTVTGAGTLASGAADKYHCFSVSVTDGTETFTDDQSGGLTGSLGGTGTINYISGLVSVTFNTAPTNAASITSSYSYVDETLTWNGGVGGGIANLLVPASRVSGQPNVFRQDHGGNIVNIASLKDHKFCGHESALFDLLPSLDDTKTTNTLFRDNIGVKFLRGMLTTPEGIYAVDTSDKNNQKFVLISYSSTTTDIKPLVISPNLDLTNFLFNQLYIQAFEDYILYFCSTSDSTINNRVFLYHRIYKTWDLADYYGSCGDIYSGTLLVGDSVTNNVQTLFSGNDANGDVITNYWKSGVSKLGFLNPRGKKYTIRAMKKSKKVLMEGNIGPDQAIHLYFSPDRGSFVEILDDDGNPFIQGSGAYVDRSQRVDVGSPTIGRTEVGGGSDGIEAYHYERVVRFRQDKFVDGEIMFVASGVGHASITNFEFRDLRVLQDKPARKYRS